MAIALPKAESVTEKGEPDGWSIPAAFFQQHDPTGPTRLVVSVPTAFLGEVFAAMVRALNAPVSVLYRQKVDRTRPRPNGSPPRDYLALELEPEVVIAAAQECSDLLFHDARFELWVRGRQNEQLVLDADGMIYLYPDDPSFRDVCRGFGLVEGRVPTLIDRDYVKQWYHEENDVQEQAFIAGLGLEPMAAER